MFGIMEIDVIWVFNDFNEIGMLNLYVWLVIVYNCEFDVIEMVWMNGVLFIQFMLRGGVIFGIFFVMFNDCWNWEDGIVLEDDGIYVNWLNSMQGGEWWNENKECKKNEYYEENKWYIVFFFE